MTHAWGKSCKLAAEAHDGFDIKQYVSTAYVARDMLEIVEKHAEWVAKKVKELSTKEHTVPRTTVYEEYTPGKAKLQYWGFSYGTYLGSTFSSMFPDRVSRVVLDGVVSAYDYNHSLGNGSLVDTEKGWKSFYTYCYNADECALRKENATVEDIKERFERILQSLYHSPLPVVSANGPEVLTYSDLKMIMFGATYQPQAVFAFLADLLVDIEQGGGETLDLLSFAYRRVHVYSCPINGSDPVLSAFPGVAEWAILCGDGLDQSHVDLQNFVEYWNLLEDISPVAGSIWAMLRMRCAAWKFNATYTCKHPQPSYLHTYTSSNGTNKPSSPRPLWRRNIPPRPLRQQHRRPRHPPPQRPLHVVPLPQQRPPRLRQRRPLLHLHRKPMHPHAHPTLLPERRATHDRHSLHAAAVALLAQLHGSQEPVLRP